MLNIANNVQTLGARLDEILASALWDASTVWGCEFDLTQLEFDLYQDRYEMLAG